MNTTKRFSHLGALPFCPIKVDVSMREKWITLSGHKKGDTLPEDELKISIRKSLIYASKLYWLLFGVTGEASATDGVNNVSVSNPDADDSDYRDTRDRACGYVEADDPPDDDDFTQYNAVQIREIDRWEADNEVDFIFSQIFASNIIYALYDGETDDSDNFVGYGALGASATASISWGGQEAYVRVVSYLGVTGSSAESAYVTLGGMHWVGYAEAYGGSSDSFDAETLTASSTVTPESGTPRIASAALEDLVFFDTFN